MLNINKFSFYSYFKEEFCMIFKFKKILSVVVLTSFIFSLVNVISINNVYGEEETWLFNKRI